MGVTIGPEDWWLETPDTLTALVASCPVGTILPDKSAVICKAGGVAWIVAPSSTQVSDYWAGGQYNTTQVGDRCCVSEWSSLCSALVSAGLSPGDWFVPSCAQLQNPGYVCKDNWDSFSAANYWSSTEINATSAHLVLYYCSGCSFNGGKVSANRVRAFRCVTY